MNLLLRKTEHGGAGHGNTCKARILLNVAFMPHDFRTVAFSTPGDPDLPEHSLWVLTKDGWRVEARTRMVPAGPELRIYYNGNFFRSEIIRDGRNIGDVADAAKADWLARGWVVA